MGKIPSLSIDLSFNTLIIGGLACLLAFTALPTKVSAATYKGECVGYGSNLHLAQSKLKEKCKVTFSKKAGHYCTKVKSGYRCHGGTKVANPLPDKPAKPDGNGVQVPPPESTSCKTHWAPAESDLANANWGSGGKYTGGKDRVSFDASSGSVKIAQPVGKPMQLSDHRNNKQAEKGNVARMTVEMLLSPGFKASGGSRFAIGMRGGASASSSAGNGANRETQDGWSLRVNYDSDLKPMMHGYHLNRSSNFGSGSRLNKSLPTGQWVTIVIEVKLNTAGKSDGSAFMKVFDKNGKLYDQTAMSGVVWRRAASWDNFGVFLTDKYKDAKNSNQYILYRNYKMVVGKGNAC